MAEATAAVMKPRIRLIRAPPVHIGIALASDPAGAW